MSKLKTHKGAAKRFRLTASGKVKRGHSFARHILTSKTTKSKRQMRGTREVAEQDAPKLNRMLPYKEPVGRALSGPPRSSVGRALSGPPEVAGSIQSHPIGCTQ